MLRSRCGFCLVGGSAVLGTSLQAALEQIIAESPTQMAVRQGLSCQCSALCINPPPLSRRLWLECQGLLLRTKGFHLNPVESGNAQQALDVCLSAGSEAVVHLSSFVFWARACWACCLSACWGSCLPVWKRDFVPSDHQCPGVALGGGFPWSSSSSYLRVLLSVWRSVLYLAGAAHIRCHSALLSSAFWCW